MKKLKIATLRAKNNWTQLDVAKKIGITKSAYSNIETGKRKPSFNVIIKLQKIFNASIDFLLEQETNNVNKNTQQNNTMKK